MRRFEMIPKGPFSLGASRAFLEGFAPAAYRGAEEGHLHLAFVPDGEEAAAGVCLRQPGGVVGGGGSGGADPGGARGRGGGVAVAGGRRERFPGGGAAGPGGRGAAGA